MDYTLMPRAGLLKRRIKEKCSARSRDTETQLSDAQLGNAPQLQEDVVNNGHKNAESNKLRGATRKHNDNELWDRFHVQHN